MSRFTAKLAGVLLAVGCGSTAMAEPDHGQWRGPDHWEGASASQDQGQSQAPGQTQPQGQAQPPGQAQPQGQAPLYQSPNDPSPPQANQGTNQNQPPFAGPQQGPSDAWNNNDDDDEAEASVSPNQRRLGVMVMQLTPELRQFFGASPERGVLIAKVEPNSTAQRAGVQVGDVLVRVGHAPVTSATDVIQALAAQPSERVRLVVLRHNQQVRLQATMQSSQRTQLPDQSRL